MNFFLMVWFESFDVLSESFNYYYYYFFFLQVVPSKSTGLLFFPDNSSVSKNRFLAAKRKKNIRFIESSNWFITSLLQMKNKNIQIIFCTNIFLHSPFRLEALCLVPKPSSQNDGRISKKMKFRCGIGT